MNEYNLNEFTPHRDVTIRTTEPEKSKVRSCALSTQVDGSHYKNFKIQPVEFAYANDLNFLQGSIIKYVCRYKSKTFY
jgi:hypothetical protein